MSEPDGGREGPPTTTYNILFVCTGNTCRSPLAEAIARRALEERGWRHVRVASAGLAARPGDGPSEQAVVVAQRRGIDLEAHRSRPLTSELLDWADLVLGMSSSHVAAVNRMGAAEKGVAIADFAAGGHGHGPGVRDPYGGPVEAYEETYEELSELVSAVLDRLAPILAP